ncbi:MAG: hypothetical protein QOI24_759 [Acidobacteriota bacterium]|nr:hypothetical protein [Acidobacteriota bacterium]
MFFLMARGWESKSVESQMEDRLAAPGGRGRSGHSDELEKARKRESIEASRRRVERELASSHSDVHRAALRNALEHLDAELRKLT